MHHLRSNLFPSIVLQSWPSIAWLFHLSVNFYLVSPSLRSKLMPIRRTRRWKSLRRISLIWVSTMIYRVGQLCGGGSALCDSSYLEITMVLSYITHVTHVLSERQRRAQLTASSHQRLEEVCIFGCLISIFTFYTIKYVWSNSTPSDPFRNRPEDPFTNRRWRLRFDSAWWEKSSISNEEL